MIIAEGLITLTNFQESVRVQQRKLYLEAKYQTIFRFCSIYDKVYRSDILQRVFELVRQSQGSPGIDGEIIETIKNGTGKLAFLLEIQD